MKAAGANSLVTVVASLLPQAEFDNSGDIRRVSITCRGLGVVELIIVTSLTSGCLELLLETPLLGVGKGDLGPAGRRRRYPPTTSPTLDGVWDKTLWQLTKHNEI